MGWPTVKIIVKDGRVDRVFADYNMEVEVIDLDTQDEEELVELQTEVADIEATYTNIY